MAFHVPENKRSILPKGHSLREQNIEAAGTNNGMFRIGKFNCVVSEGGFLPGEKYEWEHVSVSIVKGKRCPTWEEMCRIKSIFWDEDDCVLQYHPPKSDYVNYAEYVLHLWRPMGTDVPRPPSIMVGPKS